jgi:uncharacterized protein YjiS (DUF1127 family)
MIDTRTIRFRHESTKTKVVSQQEAIMTQSTTRLQSRATGTIWQRLNAVTQTLETLLATAHQRRDLRRLDDHMLKDIGLNRVDVDRETHRSFWDVANCKRQ